MRSVKLVSAAMLLLASTCVSCLAEQTSSVPTEDQAFLSRSKEGRSDQDFITSAVIGCMFQIEAARVAMRRQILPPNLSNGAIKIIEENTQIYAALVRLAAEKGFAVPIRFDPKHQDLGNRLFSCPDDGFVDAYIGFQAKARGDLVSVFKKESQSTSDSTLRTLSQDSLSILHEHPVAAASLP
jgi:predicted outer membrane protein